MKYRTISVVFWVSLYLTACNNNSDKQANEDNKKAPWAACYAYRTELDTVLLNTNTASDRVTGQLTYKLYEKDRNNGRFEGQWKGDTLIGNYIFQSEGVESVRQVAFLKKGNDYIEGFGDIEEKTGVTTFKDPSKLNFESNIILKKVDCKN